MNPRLHPLSKETFDREIWPLIEAETKRMSGRPPKIDHSACFCAMPKCRRRRSRGGTCRGSTAPWHTIYMRFKRWSENGLLWKILSE
jgi:hypothetical protein